MRNTNLTSESKPQVNTLMASKYTSKKELSEEEVLQEVQGIVFSYAMKGGNFFKQYPRQIGLLKELYRRAAGTKVNQRVLDILNDPRYEFAEDCITDENMDFLLDHLDKAFAYIVNPEEYTWSNDRSYMQPTEVTSFLVDLADIPEGATVYNPFAGLCSYSIALKNNHVVGEELNSTTWAIAQIRLFIYQIDADIQLGDSFAKMEPSEKFDVIITSPVYGCGKGHDIQDIVSQLYDKLTDTGKLVCLVPATFLNSNRKAEQIRTRLIQDKTLRDVILLPGNVFPGTGFAQAVLIISKDKEDKRVILANATEYTRYAKSTYRMTQFEGQQFLADLNDEIEDYYERGEVIDDTTIGAPFSYDELRGNDLMPSHYLIPTPEDGISCTELMEEIRPLKGSKMSADYFVTSSSIPEAMHRKPFELSKETDTEKIPSAKRLVKLSTDCVIVAQQGRSIRTVYVEANDKIVAYRPSSIRFFKPKSGYSAKYIAALLTTTPLVTQIVGWLSENLISGLACVDFSRIIVPYYKSEDERERVINQVISSEMSELETELQETIASQKREMRSTRHAMAQTMFAFSSKWELLKMFAEKKNGKIDLTDMIGRVNPISVKDLMTSLDYTLNTLRVQVDSLRLERVDWGKDELIYPYEFINEYIAQHSNPTVKMTNRGSESKIAFYASPHLVRRIFDNIVANAMSHGFTDSQKPNHEIRFDWTYEEGNMVISIANNGEPLKEGVTEKDVLMSGFSTALNKDAGTGNGSLHSGFGCYEIKMLMEDLGSVKVISQPQDEFTVIYKLTFKKTNWETANL
jgi:type I restriction enzyme M protein